MPVSVIPSLLLVVLCNRHHAPAAWPWSRDPGSVTSRELITVVTATAVLWSDYSKLVGGRFITNSFKNSEKVWIVFGYF